MAAAAGRALLRRLASSLLDFVYPPFCLVCDAGLHRGESLVCDRCWQDALRARGLPAPPLLGGTPVHAPFAAGPTLFSLLHEAKYRGRPQLLERLGVEIGRFVSNVPELRAAACFVPVPLHGGRRRERGYNQSEILARAAARAAGAEVSPQLLSRRRDTRPQARLSMEARPTNVRDAFRVLRGRQQDALAGRIVLVDDVVTSGATVLECVRVLQEAGARDVRVLALVRA